MESSSESLLHGGMKDPKSSDQDGLTKHQQHIPGKRSKNKYPSSVTINYVSLILNVIFITSFALLWREAIKPSRTKYGRLISEYISIMY